MPMFLSEDGLVKTNYVLIDYENVQPEAMAVLAQEHFKVIVFVGANQAKVTFEVASALQQMGDRAEYVKITGNGSNALDFHIAFCARMEQRGKVVNVRILLWPLIIRMPIAGLNQRSLALCGFGIVQREVEIAHHPGGGLG